MLNKLAVTVLILSYSLPAMACTCSSAGNFTEASTDTPLIIRGRVKKYGPQLSIQSVHSQSPVENLFASMDVEVLEVIKGALEEDRLTLLGDPGNLCREYVSTQTFPLEGEFLFAIQTPENSEVALSSCGEFFLAIRDGAVHGTKWTQGKPKAYSIPYKSLRNTLISASHSKEDKLPGGWLIWGYKLLQETVGDLPAQSNVW